MWKWIISGLLSSSLLLQGCVLNDMRGSKEEEKEEQVVREEKSEQLLHATEGKKTGRVRKLLKEGVNINIQDSQGRTPIMIAVYNNDLETSKVLIEAGADVNIQDNMKNNPFLYAGAEGYIDILKLTIDAGADPSITNRYGGTALIPASEHGYIDVIMELLTRSDIDVNHVNNLGWTALLEAIILNNGNEKQQQTVKILIEHGADVNIPDSNNVTPLQHARDKGFKAIEEILLQAGAK
ncbi:ankyrin repeat domain-containing protein [Lederbergia wuyishanensis]|uniref:Ankyrin repeat protein n=1 Tax=Lederbergia wuyishanensis TaxID=1347903 RepID=A0ABU0D5M7_9BACI|nr:ankyrin repeat domain-containing protein [Lederbergia wuyishanensis]MCJ8009839.1 ankyrin repeat domain-containing protein [Lederbergia wuyishanensis]MDQ0343695.1 ankyrin repeat protein [Lederbergia wuyishanensis]